MPGRETGLHPFSHVIRAGCGAFILIAASLSFGAPLAADEGGSAAVRSLIARHAANNGVPGALADAVVRIESRYNPAARNGPNLGLGQISHRTAKGLGYRGSPGGLLVAETNLTYSMRYLGQAYRLAGGDICGTIMRYQGGHGARRMSAANRVYCTKVRSIMAGRALGTRVTASR